MRYLSIYRENWLRGVLLALNHAFITIEKNLKTIDWYDGLFAKEEAEATLGIAFIAAQTYITGIVTDVHEIEGNDSKHSRIKLISSNSPYVKENITSVQLIDTVANFYKHKKWGHISPLDK